MKELLTTKELLTAIISAVTSLLVVMVTYVLNSNRETKNKEKIERDTINFKYLNPLRFSLVENYFRLTDILKKVTEEGKNEALLFVSNPEDVSKQEAEWFNGKGCYLISSCYLTARLFYQINKVRDELPYLRLIGNDDTELITLLTKVSLSFRKEFGIYYLIQPSIGNDIYLYPESRIMSYREFCQALQNPATRVWFDRLIGYYIEIGKGQKLKRVEEVKYSIQELSTFLDRVVGGGKSIRTRLEIEGIKSI
jgi:hypothetical protein